MYIKYRHIFYINAKTIFKSTSKIGGGLQAIRIENRSRTTVLFEIRSILKELPRRKGRVE